MWYFRHLFAACLRGDASGRGRVLFEPGGGPGSPATSAICTMQASYVSVSTTSTLGVARATLDPEAWKSDVISRVSVDLAGGQADGRSWRCTISDDGRFVAFDSKATDLVPGDNNTVTVPGPAPGEPSYTYNGSDIFVLDRQTGLTELVSVAGGRRSGRQEQRCWRSSARRVAGWSFSPRPTTWCRVTPTANATSSCAIGRRELRSASAWGWTAPKQTAGAVLGE